LSWRARVQDLVHRGHVGMSSLVASLSSATELIEDHIDMAATNGVRWGTKSALVAVVSHFLELGTELEPLGSGRNTNLIEDHVVTL
jgi:hypothetical protein